MDIWEKINTAQRMQDYINQHIDENITLEDICGAARYSKWYAFRIFKDIFHKTPFEYIRALRLTNAAGNMKNDFDINILDIAINTGFNSHEGFTKAFNAYFGVNPIKYRDHVPMRYLYVDSSPILNYYLLLNSKERMEMAENQRTVTVTIVEKPNCKLILKRGIKATDYFGLCDEIGSDAWEVLETIPQALDKVAYIELPTNLITLNTSKSAFGVEVPVDFNGKIPEGFEMIDLPSSLFMWFNGAPYESDYWFGDAHAELSRAIKNYKPEIYGYEFAYDSVPHFQYGTSAATGCREMIPVRRIPKK